MLWCTGSFVKMMFQKKGEQVCDKLSMLVGVSMLVGALNAGAGYGTIFVFDLRAVRYVKVWSSFSESDTKVHFAEIDTRQEVDI